MADYTLPGLIAAGHMAPAPEPGTYPRTPEVAYRLWGAANQSLLKVIRGECEARALEQIIRPSEKTDSQRFGLAAHCALLRPDDFQIEYARGGQCEGQTQKGERCQLNASHIHDGHAFCKRHAPKGAQDDNREVLTPDTWDALIGLRDAAFAHPKARNLLRAAGQRELPITWADDGGRRKAMLDLLIPRAGLSVDLKTAESVDPDKFYWSFRKYGYAIQAALSMAGLERLGMPAAYWQIIAFEKQPPYLVSVFEVEEETIRWGWRTAEGLLWRWDRAMETGKWDGYGEDVHVLGLRPEHMAEEAEIQTF